MDPYALIVPGLAAAAALLLKKRAGLWLRGVRPSAIRAIGAASVLAAFLALALWFGTGDARFMPVAAAGLSAWLILKRGRGGEEGA